PEETEKATEWLRRSVVFIQKKKRELMTGRRLIEVIEYAVKVYGLNMVIIDPFNEIDHSFDRSTQKTEYIANFIMELKDLSDSYKIVIICSCHPPSEVMRYRMRSENTIYTLADVADSSHFANKSDIGLCFWRPNDLENTTIMNIDKIKNTELYGRPTG